MVMRQTKQSPGRGGALPFWKFRREMHRLWLLGGSLLTKCAGPIPRIIYDNYKATRIDVTNGSQNFRSDVAIFLIYSPDDLSASYFITLKHLHEKGFAILVVANHPFSKKQRDALSPYVWRIMTRPNFGYDFGGYREGILYLFEHNFYVKNLLVMNDSIWFPLTETDDVLDTMRSWKEHVRGYSMHEHRRSKGRPFIQSFLFMFNEEIYRSALFREYWKNIPLSNNKQFVIRQLEMKMSVFFEMHGFKVRALYSTARISELLATMDHARQARFLEFERSRLGTSADEALTRLGNGDQLSIDEWSDIVFRSQVDGHILKLPPEILFDVFEVNMLKKLRAAHFIEQRYRIKSGNYLNRVCPEIRREIENRDSQKDTARILRYYTDYTSL
jgi:hypothetical protein